MALKDNMEISTTTKAVIQMQTYTMVMRKIEQKKKEKNF
jgi:hypothetical protein